MAQPIRSFQEADLSDATARSLVIFDVDEVLIAPEDAVLTKAGHPFHRPWLSTLSQENLEELLSVMLSETQYALVDPQAPAFVRSLQERSVPAICLTSCYTGKMGRISSMEEWRIHQLRRLELDFSGRLVDHTYENLDAAHPPCFYQGVLFCGGLYNPDKGAKGTLLSAFLDRMDLQPDQIYFFDDEEKNLLAVGEEAKRRGISYRGYWFTRPLPPLDPDVAALQYDTAWREKRWLTDKEAKAISERPKAVVFDFGGVMTTEPDHKRIVSFLCASMGLSEEEFARVNEEKRQAIARGLTDRAFWLQYADQNGIALEPNWGETFQQILKDSVGLNPAMFALVGELKESGLPVALLSNIDRRLATLLDTFQCYEPFEPCVLSYQLGFEKPDPRAYQAVLDQLNLSANEVVFIDDLIENVEAARALGFDAIHFQSVEQLKAALQERKLLTKIKF